MKNYFLLLLLFLIFIVYVNSTTESTFSKARRLHESRGKNKIQNNYYFNKAIELYQKEIDQGIEKGKLKKVARAYKNLGNLYRSGIPDKYILGKKIIGVPRDLNKAVDSYNNAYRYGSIDSLILLADMYHYDFIEDFYQEGAEDKAKDLYNYIVEIGNSYQKAIANQRLSQMIENSRNDTTPFLTGYSSGFQLLPNVLNRNEPSLEPTNRDNLNPREIIPLRGRNGGGNGNGNGGNNRLNGNGGNTLARTEIIVNDSQNVHDHGVVNTIKESIKKLKLTTDRLFNTTDAMNQITGFINSNSKLSHEQKEDAFKTLDRIATAEGVLSGTNETEADALTLVWNRIHNDINRLNKENLKDNLANELIESVEHGSVVCSRGRFNRIIDTLNKVDPEVNIKPQWAYKQEMISKANVIRKNMINELPKSEKKAIEDPDPNPEQEQICNIFNERYRKKVIQDFKKEYVTPGLLNENVMKAEVNSWIDSIE